MFLRTYKEQRIHQVTKSQSQINHNSALTFKKVKKKMDPVRQNRVPDTMRIIVTMTISQQVFRSLLRKWWFLNSIVMTIATRTLMMLGNTSSMKKCTFLVKKTALVWVTNRIQTMKELPPMSLRLTVLQCLHLIVIW